VSPEGIKRGERQENNSFREKMKVKLSFRVHTEGKSGASAHTKEVRPRHSADRPPGNEKDSVREKLGLRAVKIICHWRNRGKGKGERKGPNRPSARQTI